MFTKAITRKPCRALVDGITTASGNFQSAGAAPLNVAWSGVGQYLDLVNPCAFLRFVGAVANDGKVTEPYLVERISVDGNTTYQATVQAGEQIISSQTAAVLQEYMLNNVTTKYGAEKFPGLVLGAKTGTAEVEGQKPNAMLAGFVADEEMPLRNRLEAEAEYLGYLSYTDPKFEKNVGFVLNIDTKYSPKITMYMLATGETIVYKLQKKSYERNPFSKGDVIKFNAEERQKSRKVDGQWIKLDEYEKWMTNYIILKDI